MEPNFHQKKYRKYKHKYHNLKSKYAPLSCPEEKYGSFDSYMKNSILVKPEYRRLIDDKQGKMLPPYVFVKDICCGLKYYEKQYSTSFLTNYHVGQRKLFMNELQFLTRFMKSHSDQCYVVYAGAAPSNHIYYLHELFPKVKFILVDPAPFKIYLTDRDRTHLNTKNNDIVYLKHDPSKKFRDEVNIWSGTGSMIDFIKNSSYKIYLIQDFYTDDLSRTLNNLNQDVQPVYFMSDIRTKLDLKPGVKAEGPSDIDIIWNLAQQHNWVRFLKPAAFMLKFRCSYFGDLTELTVEQIYNDYINKIIPDKSFEIAKNFGLDFISDYVKKELKYFAGDIYIQPWGPKATTEVRLVSDNYESYNKYDCNTAEMKFFYYNLIDRTFVRHVNTYANEELGFDHCNDCALEAKIWEDYGKKFISGNFSVISHVKKLEHVLGRKLKINGHGYMFGDFSVNKYKKLYESQCL